jgi:hypothetical protein
MNYDYYKMRIQNVREKIEEEIKFFDNSKYCKSYPFDQYPIYLKGRLTSDKPVSKQSRYDKIGNRYEVKKMNMDEYAKDINVMMFKKPWNKMGEIHKIMKIKEYIDNLNYGDDINSKKITENREDIRTQIMEGMKEKKFVKGKNIIEYDTDQMIIINIDCIVFNEESGLYDVTWE